MKFQFTHPVRGATMSGYTAGSPPVMFQFTHPVRGATEVKAMMDDKGKVSIHAPREGCDWKYAEQFKAEIVSIHAPREGCDSTGYLWQSPTCSFNSRTP